MNDEEIRKIINTPPEYDEAREDTLRSWLKNAWPRNASARKMRWVILNVYIGYLICLVPMILSTVAFFRTDSVKYQILYAALFIFCSHWIGFVSVFGWVMLQRPRISREIKRLELRIAQLTQSLAQEQKPTA